MLIKSFFFPKQSTIKYRKKRGSLLRQSDFKVTKNFKKFGYDYFDNSEIKSGYDKYVNDGRYSIPIKKIIKKFNLNKRDIICEFGCAKGYALEMFRKLGFKIIGFEISKYAKNRSNIRNFIKITNKVETIKKYKFDFFYSKNVLPHMLKRDVKKLIDLAIKQSSYKPYFVIHTYKSKKDKNLFFKWDKTHKILFNISEWKNFLKKYDKKIVYSFDILF